MINPLNRRIQNRINLTLFIITLFILGGCIDTNTAYHSSRDVSVLIWKPKDSLLWDFSWADTLSSYNIWIDVRNDNQYPYQNLGLEITLQKGDTLVFRDTTELQLASPEKGWNGGGWGSIYQQRFFFKQLIFPYTGNYHLSVRPCMNDWKLKGIKSIGILIRKDI